MDYTFTVKEPDTISGEFDDRPGWELNGFDVYIDAGFYDQDKLAVFTDGLELEPEQMIALAENLISAALLAQKFNNEGATSDDIEEWTFANIDV